MSHRRRTDEIGTRRRPGSSRCRCSLQRERTNESVRCGRRATKMHVHVRLLAVNTTEHHYGYYLAGSCKCRSLVCWCTMSCSGMDRRGTRPSPRRSAFQTSRAHSGKRKSRECSCKYRGCTKPRRDTRRRQCRSFCQSSPLGTSSGRSLRCFRMCRCCGKDCISRIR